MYPTINTQTLNASTETAPALSHVLDRLHALNPDVRPAVYQIPGLWLTPFNPDQPDAVTVDPAAFYAERITQIIQSAPLPVTESPGGGEWTRRAAIYNMLPRLTGAFDHDGDGQLSTLESGWHEQGTFLKCIALLPYIKAMGFNTVHLLPCMTVGSDGHKGTIGSPYAIRNLYQLDPMLAEPCLGLSAEELFAAFVEAAHRLGIRIVMEFVLRLAAKDADWIAEHPDWFYWIKAETPDRSMATPNGFGNPIFPQDKLNLARYKVDRGDFRELPAPPAAYRALYTLPPRPDQIRMEDGRYIGTLDDGTRVRIPGAFQDYPIDGDQPPWSDATYFRLYTHPNFNYVAYNTLRMYDEKLAQPDYEHTALWEALIGVIPYYQRQFGIDGVMIDMGHALPARLKTRMVESARAINPDFAFWDENFGISQASRDEGYNAVMGYWMLAAHHGDDLRNILSMQAKWNPPVSYFAAPENHNTPRAAARVGGRAYARYALTICALTPALPFILSGFELGESAPMNTGLGFNLDEARKYPDSALTLFSGGALNWTRPDNLCGQVRDLLALRARTIDLLTDSDPDTTLVGAADHPAVVVFSRKGRTEQGDQWLSVIANADPVNAHQVRVVVNIARKTGRIAFGTAQMPGAGIDAVQETAYSLTLRPNEVIVIEGEAH